MSLKLRRYHSNESDYTRTGRNKMTFDIPPSVGFSDLTQSKLVLDVNMEVLDDQLIPCTFGIQGEMTGAKAILRNARVKSRQYGMFSERTHINVLDSNLDWYEKSRDLEDAESLFGNTTNRNYGLDNNSKLPDNPWLLISRPKQGETFTQADNPSTTRRAEIPIPLRHIDQLATIQQFPNVAVGELHYEVELEDQFNVVAPVVLDNRCERLDDITAVASHIGSTANPLITTKTTANFNRPPKVGDLVDVIFGETLSTATRRQQNTVISAVTDNGTNYELVFNSGTGITTTAAAETCVGVTMVYSPVVAKNVAASSGTLLGSGTQPILIESQDIINDKASHHGLPFYIGQPVRCQCSNATAVAAQNTTISSIEVTDSQYKIVLATPVTVTNGAALTGIYLSNRDWRSADNVLYTVNWRVNEAYIQLAEIQLAPKQIEAARKSLENLEIPFMQQRVLIKDMPTTSLHTDVVHALPGCIGLAVLTPQNLRLLSGWDNCERYRFAINGIEATNRDVHVYDAANPTRPLVGRQLHNYLLKKYFANMQKPLMKYDANVSDYTSADNKSLHSLYPLVTPLVNSEQTIQIQLFADNGNMSQKSLFYVFTHPRMLKIANGRVSIV